MQKKTPQRNNEDYGGQNHLHTLVAEVGYLRGVIEGIDEKLDTQVTELATVKTKIAGYDIWFGKFGAGMAVLAVAFSFAVNFLVDAIKTWLHLKG